MSLRAVPCRPVDNGATVRVGCTGVADATCIGPEIARCKGRDGGTFRESDGMLSERDKDERRCDALFASTVLTAGAEDVIGAIALACSGGVDGAD